MRLMTIVDGAVLSAALVSGCGSEDGGGEGDGGSGSGDSQSSSASGGGSSDGGSSGGGGSDARAVAQGFIDALSEDDYAAACALFDPAYVESITDAGGTCEGSFEELSSSGGVAFENLEGATAGEPELGDDETTATVPVSKDGETTGQAFLVTVDDEWRVTFDPQ